MFDDLMPDAVLLGGLCEVFFTIALVDIGQCVVEPVDCCTSSTSATTCSRSPSSAAVTFKASKCPSVSTAICT
jgi:hypothetical protein